MNFKQARKQLESLGFYFNGSSDRFGTITPEPYDVGKNHFSPLFRDVFMAECNGGYYVTSHIRGEWRGYRCRYSYSTDIGNIFGGGSTLNQALEEFIKNFKAKIYNISIRPAKP